MAKHLKTKRYGLIGYPLSHSFSPSYFSKKFADLGLNNAEYLAYELKDISEIEALLDSNVKGLNVTIPYKEQVLAYLGRLSPQAKAIGAVNTIEITGEEVIGHNTDVYGFQESLTLFLDGVSIEKALVLGSGGAAKAVKYALKDMGITFTTVSRRPIYLQYDEISQEILQSHRLIINTTPLGMSPKINAAPMIPYHHLTSEHFLYDLVYNPEKTLFLKRGSAKGAAVKNGYDMLVLQAEKSWEIWNQ
jgi:shikimate dehydrogenase